MDNFEQNIERLREMVDKALAEFSITNNREERLIQHLPQDFSKEFFLLVDKVNFNLLEEKDNFYGYFLMQMEREIRMDISSPTGVIFRAARYVIHFNPLLFLELTEKQMESTIKHEILHIISMHLLRAKELRGKYSKLAMNMAMDMVVNEHLNPLPPYAITLKGVNSKYGIKLEPYETFEYYAEKIQTAMDLLDEIEEDLEEPDEEDMEMAFSVITTHDLWEESSDIDDKTMMEFTDKIIVEALKSEVPAYLASLIEAFRKSRGELPWNAYLHRLMGMVESNKKKTIVRRDRRQPDRLDLRGELRTHKAKIIVAIDTSGSIQEEEFKQAMIEVLHIVKKYTHEITIIECDDRIRKIYKVQSEKDLEPRNNTRGATKFTPVFEYANHHQVNLVIYFTDGKGEDALGVVPKGYKVLWVLSGKGEALSVRKSYGVVKKLSRIETKEHLLDATEVEKGGHSMNHHESML